MMKISKILSAFAVAAVAAAALSAAGSPSSAAGLRFEISFPQTAHAGPITGRVYMMIARKDDLEPRLLIGRTGVPFFGRDVEGLAPGQPARIDESDLGTPIESLRELPPGDYAVQGFLNVYSEFRRA